MNGWHILAIVLGASCGAIIRWQLDIGLNSWFHSLPFGTWIANIVGCFLIGFLINLKLTEFWRLLLITGFLGSLTTFSTFTAQWLNSDHLSHGIFIFLAHILGGSLAFLCGVLFSGCLKIE